MESGLLGLEVGRAGGAAPAAGVRLGEGRGLGDVGGGEEGRVGRRGEGRLLLERRLLLRVTPRARLGEPRWRLVLLLLPLSRPGT